LSATQKQVQLLVSIEHVHDVGGIVPTTAKYLPLYKPILVAIIEKIWLRM
jgi:hypothetical protein